MADINIQQKKEFAKTLYLRENLSQGEIAERVGVARQTLSRWINTEKWEELKAGMTITRQQQISNLYRQVAEINNVIAARKDGERYATAKEADALIKLANSIKKLETDAGISETVTVLTKFIEWLRPVDLDKAKEITILADAFIKDSL